MEEAERLCRRVVLLDEGRVLAAGTPAELVANAGMAPRLELRTARPLPPAWLDGVRGARPLASRDGATAVALADTALAPAALAGGSVLAFTLHRPNLADVFFSLTGRALRDDVASGAA